MKILVCLNHSQKEYLLLNKRKKTVIIKLRSNFLYSIASHFEQLLILFFLQSLPNFVPVAHFDGIKSLILSHFCDFLLYSHSIITITYLFLFLYISIYLVSIFSCFYTCFSWFLNYLVSYQYQE